MSKGIAAVCLFAFLALQYGKLASYWECRLSAESFAALCDCEKSLVDAHKAGGADNSATAIAREKTEESYYWDIHIKKIAATQPVTNTPSSLYISMIPEDHSGNIFQPPRV